MSHEHDLTGPIHGLAIPADESTPPQMIKVANQLSEFQRMVGGFVEQTFARLDPLPCGCEIVMLVNEEATPLGLPFNKTASEIWSGELRGDVLLVGQWYQKDSDEGGTFHWVSLPENFEL